MHPLVRRQLRRHRLCEDQPPASVEQWHAFIGAVGESYADFDRDRYLTERSLDLSSREMRALYDELKRSSANRLAEDEARLRAAHGLLAATLDTMSDAVLVVDADRQVVLHNRLFREMWRIPDEVIQRGKDAELLGSVLDALESPDEFLARVDYLYHHPNEKSSEEIRLKDGRILDRFSAAIPSLEPVTAPPRMWLFRDVTERRRAEEETRRLSRFLDMVLEAVPDAVFVKDARDLSSVRVNRVAEALLGRPRDALLGKQNEDLFPPELSAAYSEAERRALSERTAIQLERSGQQAECFGDRLLSTRTVPIFDDDGIPLWVLRISHDVTDAKRKEAALIERNTELAELTRFRDEMASLIVHDFKNPIAAALSCLDYVETYHPVLENDVADSLHDAKQAVKHLHKLVLNLADLHKMETSRLTIERSSCQLRGFLDGAIQTRQRDAAAHEVRLECAVDDSAGAIYADSMLIHRVIDNLVDNALRYTRSGGKIKVMARGGADVVRIEVANIGSPIPESARELIFEKYGQSHAKVGRANLGLGLYFCRLAIETHGGRIWVEEHLEFQTVFCIELPKAPGASESA